MNDTKYFKFVLFILFLPKMIINGTLQLKCNTRNNTIPKVTKKLIKNENMTTPILFEIIRLFSLDYARLTFLFKLIDPKFQCTQSIHIIKLLVTSFLTYIIIKHDHQTVKLKKKIIRYKKIHKKNKTKINFLEMQNKKNTEQIKILERQNKENEKLEKTIISATLINRKKKSQIINTNVTEICKNVHELVEYIRRERTSQLKKLNFYTSTIIKTNDY